MRRRARVAVLAVVLLLAASCGVGPDLAATRPVLTVLLADDWAAAPAMADALSAFERDHGVRVEVRSASFGQIEEFLHADRAGPRDIDVAQWHAFAAGALGYALPVSARFEAEYPPGTFVAGSLTDVAWGGEIWGVPLDVNAMVLIVNLDLLASLGHTPADLDTWDGARTVAASAAEDGIRLTHVPVSTWSTFAWVRSNGGDWIDVGADYRGRPRFEASEVVGTFAFLADLAADDLVFVPAEVDTDGNAFSLFRDQQMVALASGTWDVARLQSADPPFRWAVRPMPVGPAGNGPGTVLGGSSLWVADHADDPDLAWRLMTHLVAPEHAIRYAREDGRLPARTDVLGDPFFDDDRYRVAVDQLEHAAAMRLLAFPGALDAATRTLHDVLHGHRGPAAAFRALQAEVEALLTSNDGG